ncbi:MAG: hypothetical protein A2W91_14680 [Bacteroidetes bacterium GWF2_38_335]|nr:MAG: hypothetical protein A2W91_14680 [Bacteroidetes bacterium GWF2_38_335]OFY78448.1 MAG: hypothetical protein A2281_15990 [Bacteroidetes bacterium RIFOXYA12_FULL_38_20]HBS88393.1 hypothetical protein [Bacteroidales bacterium]
MKYLLLLIFAVFSFVAKAQKTWSLETCINYALENNIQIKQQQLGTEYSSISLTQSKYEMLPSLNASGSQSFSFGRSVDPYTNDFSSQNSRSNQFGISSSLVLFNGFQVKNTIKKNEMTYLAGMQDLEKTKNDVALNIASAFLQILYNREYLDITERQTETTLLQVERTAKLVEAESLAEGNLFEIQSQLAGEELQVVNARNQLDMAVLNLVQLLDLDSAENFQIEKPSITIEEIIEPLPSIMDIYSNSVSNLPQIKSAEYSLRSSEFALAASKGARLPRLSINASYGTGYSSARDRFSSPIIPTVSIMEIPGGITESNENVYFYNYSYNTEAYPFMDQIKDNASTNVSISLTIPIFNNWRTSAGVKNATLNIMNSKYSLELQEKQLLKEIQQAYADASGAYKKYTASKKAVEAMEESFRYTQQKFDVGLLNSVEYYFSKNQLLKAQSELLQSKYEYIFKLKILDFYQGEPIKL